MVTCSTTSPALFAKFENSCCSYALPCGASSAPPAASFAVILFPFSFAK